jgi:hypothetical protein
VETLQRFTRKAKMTMPNRRKSLRMKGFDYTQPGPYFVTTVTRNRECLFGEIVNGNMRVNEFGCIVAEAWEWLRKQFPYLEAGESIVMPDHFHGIILIGDGHDQGWLGPGLGTNGDDHDRGWLGPGLVETSPYNSTTRTYKFTTRPYKSTTDPCG